MDKMYDRSKYEILRPDLCKEVPEAKMNPKTSEDTPDRGVVGSPESKMRMNASNPWKPKGRKS